MQDVFRPSSGGIFFQPEDDSTPHVVTNTHVSTKPRRSIKGSVAIDGQAGQGQVSVEQAEAVNYALLVTTVFEARQLVDCAISVLASASGSAVKIAIAAHHDPSVRPVAVRTTDGSRKGVKDGLSPAALART